MPKFSIKQAVEVGGTAGTVTDVKVHSYCEPTYMVSFEDGTHEEWTESAMQPA